MSELIQGVYKQSGQPDQLIPVQVDADGRIATTATATMSGEIEIKNDSGNPVPVSSPAKAFSQVAGSPFTLTTSWQKVCTTTVNTLGLRLGIAPNPSAYDIEWVSVPAGSSAPTDTTGEGVLAGEDFSSGLPLGDIYCKSATGQKLIVKVA